jgi:hypothetical protein
VNVFERSYNETSITPAAAVANVRLAQRRVRIACKRQKHSHISQKTPLNCSRNDTGRGGGGARGTVAKKLNRGLVAIGREREGSIIGSEC